jgi:hypothetical protein
MNELDQLRQQAEKYKNCIRVRINYRTLCLPFDPIPEQSGFASPSDYDQFAAGLIMTNKVAGTIEWRLQFQSLWTANA